MQQQSQRVLEQQHAVNSQVFICVIQERRARLFLLGTGFYEWDEPYFVGNQRFLYAMSMEDQMSELRAYCDKHPLEKYLNAVIERYGQLNRKDYSTDKK
jgi:hypothetical protein